MPPFSVLDARTGYWKERKAMWHEKIGNGTQSREGALYGEMALRMPDLYSASKSERELLGVSFDDYVDHYVNKDVVAAEKAKKTFSGVSSFDPVIAELVYKWFTPYPNCNVFDCFAGGITEGVVAEMCGHKFRGVELRAEQVEANIAACKSIGVAPTYIVDDGRNVINHLGVATQDLLITCPPYFNLEVYSGLAEDASNKRRYDDYIEIISTALSRSVQCLKANRFAVIVIGDAREKNGRYVDVAGNIVRIMEDAGCIYWNELVIINNDAHAKLRARGYMSTRKVVRLHQKVLVFYKGNTNKIKSNFNKI